MRNQRERERERERAILKNWINEGVRRDQRKRRCYASLNFRLTFINIYINRER
jgi:hypothetical protein